MVILLIIVIKKTNLLYTLADSRTSAVQPQQLIPAQSIELSIGIDVMVIMVVGKFYQQ